MKEKVIDKLTTLITAAFGLVAALAWNNAVKTLIDKYFGAGEGIGAMFIYALMVTCLAIVVILILEKISEKAKKVDISIEDLYKFKILSKKLGEQK